MSKPLGGLDEKPNESSRGNKITFPNNSAREKKMFELIKKEIRENFIFVIIGFVINVYLVISMAYPNFAAADLSLYHNRGIPILNIEYLNYYSIVSFAVAVILGLNQTIIEDLRGTYLFLLSKPFKRRTFFFIKIFSAIFMYLIAALIPALIMIYMSAQLKYFFAPFRSYMCYNILFLASFGIIGYLAAFYTGINSGRWFGTKTTGIFFAVIIYCGMMELPDIKRIIALLTAGFIILFLAAFQKFEEKEL